MKRKFWTIPLMVIAAACVVFLGACSSGPTVEDLIREDLTKALDEVSTENDEFTAAMEASAGDSFEQLGIDPTEFAEAYLDGYAYKIGDIAVDEDEGTADAQVTVTMKSMSGIINTFTNDYQNWVTEQTELPDEATLYAKGGEIFMDAIKNAEVADTECTFSYVKDDEGTWAPEEDAALAILEAMK